MDGLTVGAIARLTGITVRTLHHYDAIGLVGPAARSTGGYRLYGTREVERLQEVLSLRELGFGLEDIKEIVTAPGHDRLAALRRHRSLLEAKAGHLLDLVDVVATAITAEQEGTEMSGEEMLGVFGEFDPREHEKEAKERWGNTEAYRESARRTAGYGRKEWEALGAETDEINAALAALMEAGTPPESEAAMDLAEQHRGHITRWFYDCTPEIHAALGDMYVADPRFTATYDEAAPGLARYLSAAIVANVGRL